MKKKKESDDILKQFYSNLLLLNPESFYFNQNITELMLEYLQNFLKSNDDCNFRFQTKNENSISKSGNTSETTKPLNSILVPMLSLSSLKSNEEKSEFAFDCRLKYENYVKIFIQKNPIFINYKKELKSQLYYQSSQRIIFLAICNMIRPSTIKKIIFDRKREKLNQYLYKAPNIFQANIDNDDPASFINSMIMDNENKNENQPTLVNSFENSILVPDIKQEEIQKDENTKTNETINFISEDDGNNNDDDTNIIMNEKDENNDDHDDNLIPKEERQFASEVDFAIDDDQIDINQNKSNSQKTEAENSITNEKEDNSEVLAESSITESKIEQTEEEDQKENQNKSDILLNEEELNENYTERDTAIQSKTEIADISALDEKENEKKEEMQIETSLSKSETGISIPKNDRETINSSFDLNGKVKSIENEKEEENLSKIENSKDDRKNFDVSFDVDGKTQKNSFISNDVPKIQNNRNQPEAENAETQVENSFLKNGDSFMKAEREEISESQTETELFDDTIEGVDFDLEKSRSEVFDALSLSFLEMRTDVLGRFTRSTESLFERWSQISCCIFFEFVASNSSFSSLRKNSSFSGKFEDFARSLVTGFLSSEKQSYHDGVISLLPPDSKFFYVISHVTLDSIDRAQVNQKEKLSNSEDEDNELSTKYIDNKFMYFHHRSGIELNSNKPSYSTVNDSTFADTTSDDQYDTKQTTFSKDFFNIKNVDASQKVEKNENENLNEFSVSKFMNPILASHSDTDKESLESFSMKLVLAKAVHDKALKESRVLLDVNEPSPLVSRALELRGVAPPHQPPDPSNYSPRRLRKINSALKKDQSMEDKDDDLSPKNKKANYRNNNISSPKPPAKSLPRPRIKVSHVSPTKPKTKNSIQSNTCEVSANDTFYTYNRRMKTIRNENKAKNKNEEKRFQIVFDLEKRDEQMKRGNKCPKLKTKTKTQKSSIKRAQLAESRGFIIREKAIEQHNISVLNEYEAQKRSIYRDICSNEAKCAEELEKCASNGNLIIHSNLGKSVVYDKLEKNIRAKQINQSYERLNGRTKGFGMEYDTDFSQLEGPIATAIIEDGFF
ncbi:hypothetical protein M9Y10_027400 [Tritrichomonas musculus]|uniref:Uncharacterized protein n=1 Tax=Tritrichomonas musculus TaxID=1915356 RepID=A0ABR2H4W6_9EUKA